MNHLFGLVLILIQMITLYFFKNWASIKEFKKKYKSNTSLVLTDSILTNNLCKFWKDVNGVYLKSLSKFHNAKIYQKLLKLPKACF